MVVVVVVDSHIQRIVLATEETTVTQQVSHRPIKRQSRLWSQRGTKVNGSHHGDNPLLRPTGIQIATKSYAALQAMAPTNIKTVHQTSLLHSRATSIDSECCRLPTTSVLSKKTEKLRVVHKNVMIYYRIGNNVTFVFVLQNAHRGLYTMLSICIQYVFTFYSTCHIYL